jgi:hypothetical protein
MTMAQRSLDAATGLAILPTDPIARRPEARPISGRGDLGHLQPRDGAGEEIGLAHLPAL